MYLAVTGFQCNLLNGIGLRNGLDLVILSLIEYLFSKDDAGVLRRATGRPGRGGKL